MADLKTDYLDDILAESMNGKRKFRITKSDGSTEDVTLEDISEYTQKGSNFGAGDINNTNQEVNLKFDSDDVVDPMLATEGGFAADALATKKAVNELNSKMGGFEPIIDPETGKITGYRTEVGADTVFPFNDTFGATAVASQITEGYTAWVNGKLITGTRPAPITSLSGSIDISQWDNNQNKSYSVTFKNPFDTVPTVVITYAFGASAYGISSVTRTGFTCWFRYDGNGSNGKVGTAYWRADA